MSKTVHPHGLPHLNDSVTVQDLEAGAASWVAAFKNGTYKPVAWHEINVPGGDDVLILVRRKA